MEDVPRQPADSSPCPWASELPALIQGEMDPGRAMEVRDHVDGCGACGAELEELRALLSDFQEIAPATPPRRDLAERVLAMAQTALTPFRHLSSAGWAWVGMVAATVVLVMVVRAPSDARRPSRPPAAIATSEAVRWLVAAQEADGSWSPARWGGRDRWRVGLSGLAVSALASCGADAPELTRALDRGVAFLLREQGEGGRFGPPLAEHLYNHAPATLAILHVIDRHPVTALDGVARRAVDHLVSEQSASGGWGYGNAADAPNSVISAWPLEALLLARAHGRGDLDLAIDTARNWLRSLVDGRGRLGYDRPGAFPHGAATPTAVGLGLGASSEWPPGLLDGDYDLLAVYFMSGASPDDATRERLRRRVAALQVRTGSHAGSFRSADQWARDGGRVYATALALLAWHRL